MWFNDEEEFDDGEAVVPGPDSDILAKKLDSDLNSTLGKLSCDNLLLCSFLCRLNTRVNLPPQQ